MSLTQVLNQTESQHNQQEPENNLHSSNDNERESEDWRSYQHENMERCREEDEPPSYHDQLLQQKRQLQNQLDQINLQLEGRDLPINNPENNLVGIVEETVLDEPPSYCSIYTI